MNDSGRENVGGTEWSAEELIPFGKYILLDRISGGANAAVYRANVRGEAGFERLVAIKRILPHMAGDRAFIETFVREAKTVARMAHAGICPIYELGKVGESLYMAVEYVQGKDLGHILRRLERRDMNMPPAVTAWICARLCEALDYAHTMKNAKGEPAGIIHRDLSPSNVLISYEGQVKLIDFGLAKAVGRAQATNVDALKQKLSYMSPEMVKGKAIDARSDIFGLGVCLYEMITGRRLFSGSNDIDTLKLVSRASVPPPSAVIEDPPDELEIIVMRALEREPQHRFQTAGEMALALDAYLQHDEPEFSAQSLTNWMHTLFDGELEAEQARIKRLLAASSDAQLIQERRAFFASGAGAAARARAEVERRLSTELPPAHDKRHPQVPKAARIPAEMLVPPPPLGFDEEATGFYDPEKTQAAPLDLAAQIFGDGEPSGGFDEEKTVAAPLHEAGHFDEEPTRLVEGGFEEEPTTVFFNKEEGIGMQAVLGDEPIEGVPAGLNRPILAPDLEPPLSKPPGSLPAPPLEVPFAPIADSALATVALSRSPLLSPLRLSLGLDTHTPGTAAIGAGVVLLVLAILGLIFRTPAGVALGLRAPSTGSIEVQSTPGGVNVKLDGVYRGRAPLRMEGVRSGMRHLELRADGYLPVTKDVEVSGGETARLEVDLPSAQAVSEPPASTLTQAPPSGSARGQSVAGAGLDPNSAGPRLQATPSQPAPGDRPQAAAPTDRAVPSPLTEDHTPALTQLSPSETPQRARSLAPPSPPSSSPIPVVDSPAASGTNPVAPNASAAHPAGKLGTLVVYTVPWSLVFIDGRDTGRTTPLVAYPLAAGSHELRLQAATGQVHVEHLDIAAGQTVRVTKRF